LAALVLAWGTSWEPDGDVTFFLSITFFAIHHSSIPTTRKIHLLPILLRFLLAQFPPHLSVFSTDFLAATTIRNAQLITPDHIISSPPYTQIAPTAIRENPTFPFQPSPIPAKRSSYHAPAPL
jgi:hypothetical protein